MTAMGAKPNGRNCREPPLRCSEGAAKSGPSAIADPLQQAILSLSVTGRALCLCDENRGRSMRALFGTLMLVVAAPASAADYVVITLHADVNAPADAAWSRVGSFCDIAKWANLPCVLISGTGGVGSIRRLAGGVAEEPMIGATAHAYTYGQTVGSDKDIDYHGTLAIEPTGAATSRVDYTLTYDQERVPADRRGALREQMNQRFRGAVQNIKKMAETSQTATFSGN